MSLWADVCFNLHTNRWFVKVLDADVPVYTLQTATGTYNEADLLRHAWEELDDREMAWPST